MQIDHVAIVAAELETTVNWYVEHFGAAILYQDATWAFLKLGSTKLALVTPGQHPPHLAFALTDAELDHEAAESGLTPRPHRDGTRSVYLKDPSGNSVELISYPPGNVYRRPPEEDRQE